MIAGLAGLVGLLALIVGVLIWLCCRKPRQQGMPTINTDKLGSDETVYNHVVLPALFYKGGSQTQGAMEEEF